MARSRADRLTALVAAGAEVERLQAGGADSGGDLRAASRTRRALLDDLTEDAATLTDRPDAYRASIAATLDAASLDPELQSVLQAGRLTKEIPASARFTFGDATLASRPSSMPRPTPQPARNDLARRRAEQALEQARARADSADTDAGDAAEAAEDAQHALDATTRRVADLQAALDTARSDVLDAKRRVVETRRVETAARSAKRRADASLHGAEHTAQAAGVMSRTVGK